jgi:hypothetical protein
MLATIRPENEEDSFSDKNWQKISQAGHAAKNPCYPVEWIKRFICNVSGVASPFSLTCGQKGHLIPCKAQNALTKRTNNQ